MLFNLANRLLVVQWRIAKSQLERCKRNESILRTELAKTLFPNAEIGTNRLSYDNETDIKLVLKENITFKYDEAKFAALYQALPIERRNTIMASLFGQEWYLNNANYLALDEHIRKIVDNSGMITIKESMPAVEIVVKTK
jgi:hypothetical protein